jgi:hypothetical protein
MDTLSLAYKEMLLADELPTHGEECSLDDSAFIYAREDFEFNYLGHKVHGGPIYYWSDDEPD